jgi:hypothetical protein
MPLQSERDRLASGFRFPNRYRRRRGQGQWVICGGMWGAVAGIASAYVSGQMEGILLMGIFLTPALGLAGAICGAVGKRWGWATIRPLAWATLIGVGLDVFSPLGWSIGGTLGGIITGVLDRSLAGTLRGAILGTLLGIAGWGIVCWYFLGICCLLDS